MIILFSIHCKQCKHIFEMGRKIIFTTLIIQKKVRNDQRGNRNLFSEININLSMVIFSLMIVNSLVLTKVKTTKATTKRKMLKYSVVYNIENFLFIFA